MAHDWPGNIRELKSAIRRVALAGEETNSLPTTVIRRKEAKMRPVADVVQDTESQAILSALAETQWNRREAAKVLGMSYSSLRRRIRKYDLIRH